MAIDPNDAFTKYAARDFIRPAEKEEYAQSLNTLMDELTPEGALEQTFAIEIMGATWRLRRCRLVEEAFGRLDDLNVDPMIDDRTEKQQKSVDRARAQSHLVLRRSLAELRKLQKVRPTPVPEPEAEPCPTIFKLTYPMENGRPSLEPVYSESNSSRDSGTGASAARPIPADFPGNAQCPCRSGKRYKNCCRKNAPRVPNRAA